MRHKKSAKTNFKSVEIVFFLIEILRSFHKSTLLVDNL